VQAQAFAVSTTESKEAVTSYALAVADAISAGGEKATTAYAAAFSAAYAGLRDRRVLYGLQAQLLSCCCMLQARCDSAAVPPELHTALSVSSHNETNAAFFT
jgi:hypothetical protein